MDIRENNRCPRCNEKMLIGEIPFVLMESGKFETLYHAKIEAEKYGWSDSNKKLFTKWKLIILPPSLIRVENPTYIQCPSCDTMWHVEDKRELSSHEASYIEAFIH